MPEKFSLHAQTALFAPTPRKSLIGQVAMAENPDIALASLARRRDPDTLKTFADKARDFFGCDLPGPGQMSMTETFKIFWIGPEQWMICAAFDRHELLDKQLNEQFGSTASVTEQTDAWCAVSLSGSGCQELFMRLCPIDIASFDDRSATRTTIEHMGCFVIRTRQDYLVLIPRSFSVSAWGVIESAARSIS